MNKDAVTKNARDVLMRLLLDEIPYSTLGAIVTSVDAPPPASVLCASAGTEVVTDWGETYHVTVTMDVASPAQQPPEQET